MSTGGITEEWDDDALDELEEQFQARAKLAAEHVLVVAKTLAPIKSGKLIDSGRVREVEGAYRVEFPKFYAAFYELGTSHQIARPFIRPALEMARPTVEKIMGGDE